MKVPFMFGRILFGGFFLDNGINQLKQRKNLRHYVSAKDVPCRMWRLRFPELR